MKVFSHFLIETCYNVQIETGRAPEGYGIFIFYTKQTYKRDFVDALRAMCQASYYKA